MTRKLTLIANLQTTPAAQSLAKIVKEGFRLESWEVLKAVGTVYEASINVLEHPDHVTGAGVEPVYSYLVLATTYEGKPDVYQRAFWELLTPFFLLVAFSVKDSPFGFNDLSAPQKAAFEVCHGVIAQAEAANTPEEHAAAQVAFKATTEILAEAMKQDELDKNSGKLPHTKFELFIAWVNKNDRSFGIGSPQGAHGEHPGKDLRIPPTGKERSQFLNPRLQGPFPARR